MMLDEDSFGFGLCPSFSSYSINGFAEAAARVTADSSLCSVSGNDPSLIYESIGGECQEEDDFEFVLIRENEMVFPALENRQQKDFSDPDNEDALPVRNSLEKLTLCDCDPPSSSSSSEADEIDGIPPGTYCVWTPKPTYIAKSKSTGSSSSPSGRWKLRDLLRRSSSDGNSSVELVSSKKNEAKSDQIDGEGKSGVKTKGNRAPGKKASPASAHEVFYVNKRRLKEQEKRKSYLPYKQDLVGFWINFNGSGKSMQ